MNFKDDVSGCHRTLSRFQNVYSRHWIYKTRNLGYLRQKGLEGIICWNHPVSSYRSDYIMCMLPLITANSTPQNNSLVQCW